MNLLIIFIIVFLIQIKSISSDTDLAFDECFSSDGETLYFICKSDEAKRNCSNSNRENVKIMNYQCSQSVGTTIFYTNVINSLPNLRVLNVTSLKSTWFSIPNNSVFKQIKIFTAKLNQLTITPNRIFERIPNVNEIDFSSNAIRQIRCDDFHGANQLKKMNLSGNNIESIYTAIFADAKNLEVLDLSRNKLTVIGDKVFEKNDKLKILDLRHNDKLTVFNFRTFSVLATEIVVYLPSKNIETLEIGCKQSDCHFNGFQNDDYFETINNFRAEGLKQFSNFSILLEKLGQNLQLLTLSRCFIGTISKIMLMKFTSLTRITMTNANISRIEANAFLYQTRLEWLDLSYNKLKEVDSTLFTIMFQHLNTLYLEANRLERIDNITAINLPKLKSLHITKNRFSCNYLEKYLTKNLNTWKERIQLGTNQTDTNVVNVRRIDCVIPNSSEQEMLVFDTPHPSSCSSTMPYIVVIILLAIILFGVVSIAIAVYWRQKSSNRFINAHMGTQTMEFDPTVMNDRTDLNNEYEKIELRSIPSEGYSTLESRPLPSPPTTLDENSTPNDQTLPIHCQYAQVCKASKR